MRTKGIKNRDRLGSDFVFATEAKARLGISDTGLRTLIAEGLLPTPRRLHSRPAAPRIWWRPQFEEALAKIAGVEGGAR